MRGMHEIPKAAAAAAAVHLAVDAAALSGCLWGAEERGMQQLLVSL